MFVSRQSWYFNMSLSSLSNYIGNIAVVATILQFLSGLLVCKQYVIQRTTADATALPFICGVLSAALWLMYGLTKNDNKIVFVNIIGVFFMVVYSIVFYIYSLKKSIIIKQFLVMMTLLFITMAYISTEEDNAALLCNVGNLASFITLLTIAAPMSKLFHVIRVKNTECLPFPLIFMSFLVSALWACYGCLEQDIYIQNVNIIGVCLAVAQLFLFVIYPRTSEAPLLPKVM